MEGRKKEVDKRNECKLCMNVKVKNKVEGSELKSKDNLIEEVKTKTKDN